MPIIYKDEKGVNVPLDEAKREAAKERVATTSRDTVPDVRGAIPSNTLAFVSDETQSGSAGYDARLMPRRRP
jgi:hypothetical protein